MSMPRNPGEAEWLVRSAEEEAARAARWATVAQHQAAYQSALAKAHAADADGLRRLWKIEATENRVSFKDPGQVSKNDTIKFDQIEPLQVPKCEFCGKETRYFKGRAQRFCSVTSESPFSCAQRFRDRRKTKLLSAARQRMKESAGKSTSDDQRNQTEQSDQGAGTQPAVAEEALGESSLGTINCSDTSALTENGDNKPVCLYCGQLTRLWRGKPQKFCSPVDGRKISRCVTAYHGRERRSLSPQKSLRRENNTKRADPLVPSGSVLVTASSRSPGHELLALATRAVPHHLPEQLRSEIISETVLLGLEGLGISEAVAQATKNVNKNLGPLRYAKPIEDCFWLSSAASEEDLNTAAIE